MANNKMLIDAGHPEETRVVMVRGNRVDEFDFESEHKKQLRGNIYLAKVTRVEPSLQAAFVDYGGNRHGFLAFSEIHPDYYQIPVADRQALLEAEAEIARKQAEADSAVDEDDDDDSDDTLEADDDGDEDEAEEKPARTRRSRRRRSRSAKASDDENNEDTDEESDDSDEEMMADNDGDDVVSEPAEAEEKPKKRTRKKKAEAEAEATEEEKPKRKRATKKAKADEAEDVAAEEKPKRSRRKTKAEASEEETASEASASDDEKPKRKSRSRKKDAQEADASENATKADGSDGEGDEKPKRKRRSKKAAKEDNDSDSKSEVDDSAEADTSEDLEAKDEDKRSSRRRSRRGRGRGRGRKGKADNADVGADDAEVIDAGEAATDVDSVGASDALEEVPQRRAPRRNYKIQEVIKRRQVMLVQVVKEERGNKGAALTTYLSLAGRYSVLMPNTARGGGISRKITNSGDRKRLKSIATALDVPKGMGVILRTAGAAQDANEVQRDFEYLLRLWENVRTLTLRSSAPCLVYEEGSLIKRSIRDMYDQDTKEIIVAGEDGYKEARDFMEMLMPDQVDRVKPYRDRIPMFAKLGVEAQLDAMLQPQVTLKSGGYIVINQTEALVAIDVNSGRSTRQHSIEDTATQTNLEAADEIARQLRLRDMAGLIVIDFIDMEDRRNNRAVEKRLKDALQQDRARIQVGRISHFGLLEMSRQRIRASVLESTTQVCPTCDGLGHVRSASSIVLSVLRQIEESLNRSAKNNLVVKVSAETALYMLNNKREHLSDLEERFGVSIDIQIDGHLGTQACAIEKGDHATPRAEPEAPVQVDTIAPEDSDDNGDDQPDESSVAARSADEGADREDGRKRRRRRRRGGGRDTAQDDDRAEDDGDGADADEEDEAHPAVEPDEQEEPVEAEMAKPERVKRRRKREDSAQADEPDDEKPAAPERAAAKPETRAAAPAVDEPPRPGRRRTSRVGKIDLEAAAAARAEKLAEERKAKAENGLSEEERAKLIAAEPPRRPRRKTSRLNGTANADDDIDANDIAPTEEDVTAVAEATSPSSAPVSEADNADEGAEKKSGWWRRRFF